MTSITPSNDDKFKPSLRTCKTKIGCEFQLEALEDGSGNLVFGGGQTEGGKEWKAGDTVLIDFDREFTHKLREGEQILLKMTVKSKKAFQTQIFNLLHPHKGVVLLALVAIS